ncbi:hypothetical protein A2U01_0073356, partial [Trifolium medium]|nr:hypothetical protein [Trifolium medium]
MLKLGLQRRG